MKRLAIIAAAAIALSAAPRPAKAILQITADFNGTLYSCVDNAACDTNAGVGTLAIANQTIGGIQVNGSIQRSLGTPANPFPSNLLSTSSLSIINTTLGPAVVDFLVSDTSFAGGVQNWSVSGSGVWELANGSSATLEWYADAANAQGADAIGDTPGTMLSTFSHVATGATDSFSHNAAGVLTMGVPYSMTMRAFGTLSAGASLNNRGQNEVFTTTEPASLALLGVGALVVMGLRRVGSRRAEGVLPSPLAT